ncbi:MAG: hypothetical protein PVS3B1_27270 [Ktedonobacteraceae bacterium]
MNCNSCRKPLPSGASVCPNCGTLTPAYYGASGTSADARTSPSGTPKAPVSLDANPYSSGLSNPYTSVPPPPPPPQYNTGAPAPESARPPKNRTAITMGASLLALILIGAGILIFLSRPAANPKAGETSKPSPSEASTPAVGAVSLDATTAQKLYDSTTKGSPIMNEGLGAPDNYGWDHVAQPNTSCTFANGAYHAQAKPGYFAPCYASATDFSDLLLQVQMTIVSGHSGGLVFRADATNDNEYQFRISTDGTYILNKYVLDNGKPAVKSLLSGTSPAIIKGANQSNLIAIMAQGKSIAVYINKKYVDSTNDTTYQKGQIGVYTDSDPSSVVDAAFTKLEVWKL